MKITITNGLGELANSCTVESGSTTAPEVFQDCIQAMLGVGFLQESVEEAILTKAEELNDELKKMGG